jgi:hypothetical protein
MIGLEQSPKNKEHMLVALFSVLWALFIVFG